MPYNEKTGFAMSGLTYYEISERNYFKILETVKEKYPTEVSDILKPKKTIKTVEPLSKRDLLGIISIFDLNEEIPNAKGMKIGTLRTNMKKLVESNTNEELNNYLISEGLQEGALTLKKDTTSTEKTIHNKTKKLFNFIIEQYLEIELEKPEKKPKKD